MNWVDIAAVVFLLGWALWGYKRGLIYTLADLLGFLLCLAAALKAYPPVGMRVADWFPIGRGLANLISFISIFVLIHLAFMLLLDKIYRPLPLWLVIHRWRVEERLFGILPGLISGCLWLMLILATLTWFPFSSTAKAAIEESAIGKPLVGRATAAEPEIERLFGPAARESIGFLTVNKSKGKEPVNIPKTADLSIDEEAEERMLALVNNERAKVGLRPLEMDPKLRVLAREHSEEMFRLGYFAHDSPVSGSPFDRMNKAGVKYFIAGENLAYAQNVDLAHNGLMNSPDHRENVLTGEFGKVGLGVVDGGIYGEMFTQEFTD